jgi:hypothetical protein
LKEEESRDRGTFVERVLGEKTGDRVEVRGEKHQSLGFWQNERSKRVQKF